MVALAKKKKSIDNKDKMHVITTRLPICRFNEKDKIVTTPAARTAKCSQAGKERERLPVMWYMTTLHGIGN